MARVAEIERDVGQIEARPSDPLERGGEPQTIAEFVERRSGHPPERAAKAEDRDAEAGRDVRKRNVLVELAPDGDLCILGEGSLPFSGGVPRQWRREPAVPMRAIGAREQIIENSHRLLLDLHGIEPRVGGERLDDAALSKVAARVAGSVG